MAASMAVAGIAVSIRVARRATVRTMGVRRVAISVVAVAGARVRTAVAVSAEDQMADGMPH